MLGPFLLVLMALVATAACSEPRFAGVLTLAPAGMLLSEGAVPERDGTARLAKGSSATATAYAPVGELEAAIVGRALVSEEITVEVHFDGRLVESLVFGKEGEEERKSFRVRVDRAGPHTWRVLVRGQGSDGAPSAFLFHKLVLRLA